MGFMRDQSKAAVALAKLSPNSIGKTQVLAQTTAVRKKHVLLLCARSSRFEPQVGVAGSFLRPR